MRQMAAIICTALLCVLMMLAVSACAVSGGSPGQFERFEMTEDGGVFVAVPKDPVRGRFNRFTVDYSADGPVKLSIKYKTGGESVVDDFYLEEGEKTFSGLVSGFLSGGIGENVTEIKALPLTGGEHSFSLEQLTLERVPVPETDSSGNCFIENSRYKFGIRLSWGGAISYLEDKNAGIPGLSNLINQHDTGRLVQQSYYGTGAVEGVYDPGTYIDNVWQYNPVQGGDRFATDSRLVDVIVGEDEIVVRAQPKDWANDGLLLPCYMENRYTLLGGSILVYNRFVDFSGFTHPYALQELPAFYTVSYLDSLVFYNGREPWTGAELTLIGDLTDWTDPDNTGLNVFDMVRGNTEVWTALVNRENDFGIGVFTPNFETLTAGRYKYDGSKDSLADSTNYMSPRSMMKLVSFEPLEYSYLIATGSTEEIRRVFAESKVIGDNASLDATKAPRPGTDRLYDFTAIDFTEKGSEELFVNLHNIAVTMDETEGCVKLEVTDPYDVYCGLSLADNAVEPLRAEDYTILEIEYMLPKTNSVTRPFTEIFLAAGEVTGPAAGNSVAANVVADGRYHKIRIDLSAKEVWKGTVHQLRIDCFADCAVGDAFYIRSLALKKSARG